MSNEPGHNDDVEVPRSEHNRPPTWILLIWGLFAIWGLMYLTWYWAPSLGDWMQTTTPNQTQWER